MAWSVSPVTMSRKCNYEEIMLNCYRKQSPKSVRPSFERKSIDQNSGFHLRELHRRDSPGRALPHETYYHVSDFYGHVQASADAGTQPPAQTGSPKLLRVADPPIRAEQNASPSIVMVHCPGPHSIWPVPVFTIPPKLGEQAIAPDVFTRQIPPCGGQAVFPLALCTQIFTCDQTAIGNTSPTTTILTLIGIIGTSVIHLCPLLPS